MPNILEMHFKAFKKLQQSYLVRPSFEILPCAASSALGSQVRMISLARFSSQSGQRISFSRGSRCFWQPRKKKFQLKLDPINYFELFLIEWLRLSLSLNELLRLGDSLKASNVQSRSVAGELILERFVPGRFERDSFQLLLSRTH